MAAIRKLSVLIQTASDSGAGTDGDVYLGAFGREFYTDSSADDFERGASRTYTFGDGANVLHKELNDPRAPQLDDADVDRFPAYIRFVGTARGDNWRLQRVSVSINDQIVPTYELLLRTGVWLGTRATGVVFLRRHDDGGDPVPVSA